MTIPFPDGFVWGAATSSYQIEGASTLDGRSPSIWDRFAERPGAIEDGSDGSVACDHYHRWRDDIGLMSELGLQAYRFSVAWPRVIPSGVGQINEKGLGFYDRLVDGLLEAGIDPCVTLYHWDLPLILEERGGWVSRETAYAFVEYADAVARRLGDRVKTWVTHNEPWCASMLGYRDGFHAPGIKDLNKALTAAHHIMLSHGLAVPVIRSSSDDARVGITLNLVDAQPASSSEWDVEACRHLDGTANRWFLDPVFKGKYPEDIIQDYVKADVLTPEGLTFIEAGDMAVINVDTDFLGLNYYSRAVVRSDSVPEAENQPREILEAAAEDKTDIGWEVYPDGLFNVLVRVHQTYKPDSIIITENGAAYHSEPVNSQVKDFGRQSYLYGHFLAARRALSEGVPLDGFFVWSLMDNFEWSFGYKQRFGIVWVDYKTQKRILKGSAIWYRDVIAKNAAFNPRETSK